MGGRPATTQEGKMITELTPAQKARFPEFVEKWTRIGLSCEPADKPRAEAAISRLYEMAKLPAPRFAWLPDPISAARAAMAYARACHALDKSVKRGKAPPALDETVIGAVLAVRGDVPEADVRAALAAPVGDAAREAARNAGHAYFGGSFWAAWSGWADYMNEVLRVEFDRAYLDATESVGVYYTLRGACFCSDRPESISRDNRGRLHNATGAAIRYRNGWGLWSWHGVTVPQHVIERPDEITVAMIDAEPNAEVSRAMMEIIGWDRYMRESCARVVDTAPASHPLVGVGRAELLVRDRAGAEPVVAVAVWNSTAEPDGTVKRYVLRVHPELRPMFSENGTTRYGEPQAMTAENAIASTFGMTGADYARDMVAES